MSKWDLFDLQEEAPAGLKASAKPRVQSKAAQREEAKEAKAAAAAAAKPAKLKPEPREPADWDPSDSPIEDGRETCRACGGTARNSKGGPCKPCEERRAAVLQRTNDEDKQRAIGTLRRERVESFRQTIRALPQADLVERLVRLYATAIGMEDVT